MKLWSSLIWMMAVTMASHACAAQVRLMRQATHGFEAAGAIVCNASGQVCATGRDAGVEVTEGSTGRTLSQFSIIGLATATKAAISDDGKMLAIGYGMNPTAALEVFDTATGRWLFKRAAGIEASIGMIAALGFSPDGKLAGFVTNQGYAEIWGTSQWSIVDSVEGFGTGAQSLTLSNAGELTAYSADGTAHVWKAGTTAVRTTMSAMPRAATPASRTQVPEQSGSAFDPWPSGFELTVDDRLLFPGNPGRSFDLRTGTMQTPAAMGPDHVAVEGYDPSDPDVVALWDWSTGYLADKNTLHAIDGARWPTEKAMAISRDGKTLALKRGTSVVLVERTSGHQKQFDLGWNFDQLRLSSDGRTVIALGQNADTRAYAAASGRQIELPTLAQQDALSTDLHYAVQVRSGGGAWYIRVLDLRQNRALYELPLDAAAAGPFSPDGKLVAVALRSGAIVVLDIQSGRRVAVLSGFPGGIVGHMRFTADGQRLIASDLTCFLAGWDLTTQKKLFTLTEQSGEWAISTPEGHYDGTPGELKHYYWVQRTKTLPLESEAPGNKISGLMAAAWRGETPNANEIAAGTAFGLPDLPVPELAGDGGNSPEDHGSVQIAVHVPAGMSGPVKLMATRNGVPQVVTENAHVAGNYTASIALADGENQIRIWAEDAFGRSSSEIALTRQFAAEPQPRPEIVAGPAAGQVYQVAFSPDGNLMATSSGHAITLWDMRSRRQVRSILSHAQAVTQVAFGGNGAWLASTAKQEGVRIWDTKTGAEICRIADVSPSIYDSPFSVSPDGSRIAVSQWGTQLTRVFRLPQCVEENSFESGVLAPAWSGDSGLLLEGRETAKHQVVRANVDTSQEQRMTAAGEIESLHALPDGRALLLLRDGSVELEDKAGSLQPFALDAMQGAKIKHIAVLNSNRLLVDAGKTQSLLSSDLRTVERTWSAGYLFCATASADERWIGFTDTNQNLSVFDRASGRQMTLPLDAGYGAVTQLVFSPSGEVLMTGRGTVASMPPLPGSTRFLFWDIASSTVIKTAGPIADAYGNPTGNMLLTADMSRGGVVTQTLQTAPFRLEVERQVNGELAIENLNVDQNLARTVPLPLPEGNTLLRMQGWALSGSATVAATSGPYPGSVKITDLGSAKATVIRAHPVMMRQAAVSADGRLVLTYGDGETDQSVRLWTAAGTPLWRLEGQTNSMPGMGFSGDGKLAALAADGEVRVIDSGTGAILKTLQMEPADVTAIAFSPDAERLAVGTADGLTHLYDWRQGSLLATLAAEADGALAYTPDAYYSGTLTHSARLSFRLGDRVYPLRQFDLYYDRPDLLMQRLAPDLDPVIRAYKLAYEKRLQEAHAADGNPPSLEDLPRISVTAPAATTVNSAALTLPVSASAGAAAPLSYIEAQVNGVAEPRISVNGRRSFTTQLHIQLSSGTNSIEVTAVDALGRRSLTQELTIENKARAPRTLYFVAVGASKYMDQRENLQFAAKDAADLSAYFRTGQAAGGASAAFDKVVVLDPLTDSSATRENILKIRAALAGATVDDTVAVFFAGHGMLDKKLDFYFAPYDMDFAAPAQRGISIAEMEGLLEGSHSRKRLLLVDACHAGELDKSELASLSGADRLPAGAAHGARGVEIEVTPGAVNAFDLLHSLFVDLRENTGTQIISASRGTEVAYESATIANGMFTRAVLDGLQNGQADANGDGHVSVSELLEFVSGKVQELSHGRQTPNERQANLEDDFLIQ